MTPLQPKRAAFIGIALVLCLIAALTGLLSSCAKGEAHVTVNRDGSADLAMRVNVPERITSELGGGSALLDSLNERMRKAGFQSQITHDGSNIAWISSRRFERSDWGSFDWNGRFPMDGITFSNSTKKRWLYTTYRLEGAVDPSKMIPPSANPLTKRLDSLSPFVKNLVLNQLKLDLKITLPLPPKSHNAAQTEDSGRTLLWHVSLARSNPFMLEITVPNVRHIVYTVIGVLIIAAALVIYAVFRRKKRRQA
jgi:hypothetical protein